MCARTHTLTRFGCVGNGRILFKVSQKAARGLRKTCRSGAYGPTEQDPSRALGPQLHTRNKAQRAWKRTQVGPLWRERSLALSFHPHFGSSRIQSGVLEVGGTVQPARGSRPRAPSHPGRACASASEGSLALGRAGRVRKECGRGKSNGGSHPLLNYPLIGFFSKKCLTGTLHISLLESGTQTI